MKMASFSVIVLILYSDSKHSQMVTIRQYKEHTRIGIYLLPWTTRFSGLSLAKENQRWKGQPYKNFPKALGPWTLSASPMTHAFHSLYSVVLHLTRHMNIFFFFAVNIPKAHIPIHISIKINQKGKKRQDLLFKSLSEISSRYSVLCLEADYCSSIGTELEPSKLVKGKGNKRLIKVKAVTPGAQTLARL